MKSTVINFYGNEYEVSVGDQFQVDVPKGSINQIFVVQCHANEKVYLEVIQRISSSICTVRVNEIQWKDKNDVLHIERYKDKEKISLLESFTKKQLIQYIEENNLDIDTKLKKADLIGKIKDLL